jgi:LysM repeat protein
MLVLMNGPVDKGLRTGSVLQFYAPATAIESSPQTARAAKTAAARHGYKVEYTVQNGGTLARIALAFDLEISEIRRWNGIRRSHIQAGQKLTLYLPSKPLKISTHTVRKGETAASIARHYSVRLYDDLLALNGLVYGSKLTPGMTLKIYRFANSGS